MGRKCSICIHKKRKEIEEALLENQSLRHIASQFGINYRSIQRHLKNGHIEKSIIEAHELKDIIHGRDLLEKVFYLQQEALHILREAKRVRDNMTALSAIARASKLLELQGRIAGDIQSAKINISQTNTQQIAIVDQVSETSSFLEAKFPKAWKALIGHLAAGYYEEQKNKEPEQGHDLIQQSEN